MAPNQKQLKKTQKSRRADSNSSDYRLIIVLAGAVILAFLMIYVLIATAPA